MDGVSFDTASAPFGKVDESRSNDQMIHLDELQVRTSTLQKGNCTAHFRWRIPKKDLKVQVYYIQYIYLIIFVCIYIYMYKSNMIIHDLR